MVVREGRGRPEVMEGTAHRRLQRTAAVVQARQGQSYAVRAELRAGWRCAGHRRRRRRQGAAVSIGER
jgi:hypothetical protein